MVEKKESKTKLLPISNSDLDEVSLFLHNYMNNNFSSIEWKKGIEVNWFANAPNHGYMLKDKEIIVGVLCAIYSQQYVEEKWQNYCNPHSWCVLPDYRKRSVDLVLAVIRQPGFHFTMFSTNMDGVEIFGYLRFKPLDNMNYILLNLPSLSYSGCKIVEDDEYAMKNLPDVASKYYKDHAQFPWLKLVVYGKSEHFGFFIYKSRKLKKLPCASILYISDVKLFVRCWPAIRTYLLFKGGYVTSKIEKRLIGDGLKFVLKTEPDGRKFYLSNTIKSDGIQNIYSELVALDL